MRLGLLEAALVFLDRVRNKGGFVKAALLEKGFRWLRYSCAKGPLEVRTPYRARHDSDCITTSLSGFAYTHQPHAFPVDK